MSAEKIKKTYSTGAFFFIAPAVDCPARRRDLSVTVCRRRFVSPVSSPKGPLAWELSWYLANLRCPALPGSKTTFQFFRMTRFETRLGRTFLFLIICLPCELVLGLVIALLLHKQGNELLKKICRVALVIPMATTFAVVGLMGRLMFDANYGILNYLWGSIFRSRPNWLADPNLAFLSIAIMEVWQWTPFCALVLFSSLTMVPA